uniref:Activating transcription factor 7-interacting protein 2 n=1 Tax=Salvator merianae TaxID=96440 RepID=A0A8D0BLN5_SALMN
MNSDMDIKKPLRARKTMTHSSRKQIEMLNGIKNGQVAATAANGPSSNDNHDHLKTVGKNCLYYNSEKGLDRDAESKQTPLSTPLKEPTTNLVVNSEISIYNDNQDISKNDSTCPTNADVEQFWDGNALQDILYDLYHKESQSPLCKPIEVRLDTKPGRPLSDRPEDQLPGSSPVHEHAVSTADETLRMPALEPETDDSPLHNNISDASLLLDRSPRKRKNSGTGGESLSKHTRTAGEASGACDPKLERESSALVKVKCFIQRQLNVSAENMDHGLQLLHERIDRTHCLRKHEGITINIIKKISRLERRINAVISFQKAGLSRKSLPSRVPSQPKTPNSSSILPDDASNKSVLAKEKPANPNKTSADIAESSDNPHLGMMRQRADVQDVDTAGVKEKLVSAGGCTSFETSCNSKNLLLIDLTDEGNSERNCKKDEKNLADQQKSSSEILVVDSPEPVFQPSDEFSHLPPLPSSHLHPVRKGRFRDTLPPQKLDLEVVRVQRPKGIALQWNIKRLDPRCAPIESFHLFLCLENTTDGELSVWSKIDEIRALPLPMACSLSRFPSFVKCYFTMQARDIYGRYGPFCDIQSISTV